MTPISRRTLLRGAGAAVALPWLEAMMPSASAAAAGALAGPPLRLGFFYVPNGVVMANWRPKEAGELKELPAILKPLEPLKNRLLVLSDLNADHCVGKSAGHEPAGGGFLTGIKCKHSEEPEVGGPSIDQVAARHVGLQTPVDSLALGIDAGHRGDHGYSGTYMSHISWRSTTTPAALELNPKLLYERLFKGRDLRKPDWNAAPEAAAPKAESTEGSVLDAVREDARGLQAKLGFADRRKLEEYFEGLRSVERRIAGASKDSAGSAEGLHPVSLPASGKGVPTVYADHVTLMLDLMTLAFQTDTTRVASFMFSYEKSGRAYPEAGCASSHHSTSHHQNKADALQKLTAINTHHMGLFAKMLERLGRIPEGDGTLLDHVLFAYGSGISDGNKHNHDDLPIIVAGAVKGGRHVAYGKKTPLCNLWLEMARRAGVPLEKFGDGTGPLGVTV